MVCSYTVEVNLLHVVGHDAVAAELLVSATSNDAT